MWPLCSFSLTCQVCNCYCLVSFIIRQVTVWYATHGHVFREDNYRTSNTWPQMCSFWKDFHQYKQQLILCVNTAFVSKYAQTMPIFSRHPYYHRKPLFQYKLITLPSISILHMQISDLKALNHLQNRNFNNVEVVKEKYFYHLNFAICICLPTNVI